MSRRLAMPSGQLGFDSLLADATRDNQTRQIEREYAHLPGTFDEALPFFRALINRHHAAMMAGDSATVMGLREEANHLAVKLNNFEPGILAGPDAPGCMLDVATRAPDDYVPLWGQSGSFVISVGGMRARIEMEGLFGIASDIHHWLGFSAHAIDDDRPFISETGFRSFVGIVGELQPGFTPDRLACAVIAAHIKRELKGRLVAIAPDYRRAATEPR